MQSKTAVLLVNLGTPTSTSLKAVRVFLREFLLDPRVIDLPAPIRNILVNCFIVPFRGFKTAQAYREIWTNEGSPLLVNSRKLQQKLNKNLNNKNSHSHQADSSTENTTYDVLLAMRYGQPTLKSIMDQLEHNNYTRIIILPLFPQYASATSGSALEKSLKYLSDFRYFPEICCINEFYLNSGYLQSVAAILKKHLTANQHVLFSYHGLPERQAKQTGYSEQCYATTKGIVEVLQLSKENYSTSFQSRLGKLPWTGPYTVDIIKDLRKRNIKDLLVVCPSFVTDCLETLEEIGVQLTEEWLELGGTSLKLVPCLNDDDHWVESLAQLIKTKFTA